MKFFKSFAILATLAAASTAFAAPISESSDLTVRSSPEGSNLLDQLNAALKDLGLRKRSEADPNLIDELGFALKDLDWLVWSASQLARLQQPAAL
ncbi:uncharacterized protein UTRI_06452_B [Ustilago trichophora]|uniref:Uncharacterized protein n=1 Tax=Ustilago trichophora TaxID=86804 RepID=A0A5C3EQ02_9BASI|nr:uncharacterized protein UTRI_06452_B [Ustilago trichophora]